jgi:hypothetical protein
MTTSKNTIVLREEWRALNIKINSTVKAMQTNMKAGYKPSEEFTLWLNQLMARRDELTPLV